MVTHTGVWVYLYIGKVTRGLLLSMVRSSVITLVVNHELETFTVAFMTLTRSLQSRDSVTRVCS